MVGALLYAAAPGVVIIKLINRIFLIKSDFFD